ncbi:MAG: magnesium transporter CorA family protein [Janthinobacterium lividum]
MLKSYTSKGMHFNETNIAELKNNLDDIVWIDLYQPTATEEKLIENLFEIDIPTRQDMHEIELSSRLYEENNSFFMTLTLVVQTNSFHSESHVVTFILHHKTLITVRYVEILPFSNFLSKWNKENYSQGSSILVWLLQEIADQLADTLEGVAQKIEDLSFRIFNTQNTKTSIKINFNHVLLSIGRYENLLSKSQESLFNLSRLLNFITDISYFNTSQEHRMINLMIRDMPPLIEHSNFLTNKISFLLDATLGMINIEQNSIIKVVTVVSVVFLPPTLVASIYGMNFTFMPELKWHLGYPYALLLMLISGFLPYQFFKFKKWL